MNNIEKFKRAVEERRERIEKILETREPVVPSLDEAHKNRMKKAEIYLKDLKEVVRFLPDDVKIVTKQTFNKTIEKADFAELEYDGRYCQLALIQNFPHKDAYIFYMAPLAAVCGSPEED